MSNSIIFTYPKEIKNALDDVLPIPIKFNLPDWYKKLEHTREFPTIKGCMPFLDTLTSGYLLKTYVWATKIISPKESSGHSIQYLYRILRTCSTLSCSFVIYS